MSFLKLNIRSKGDPKFGELTGAALVTQPYFRGAADKVSMSVFSRAMDVGGSTARAARVPGLQNRLVGIGTVVLKVEYGLGLCRAS